MKLLQEIVEFVVQSQALMLYNGYNLFDPNNKDNIYLASKPAAINAFAMLLSFNILGSGFLWLAYGLFPTRCYGLIFQRALFFVDKYVLCVDIALK